MIRAGTVLGVLSGLGKGGILDDVGVAASKTIRWMLFFGTE
jgi:hypothetical protein